jgi:hypothetical protein
VLFRNKILEKKKTACITATPLKMANFALVKALANHQRIHRK